MKEKEKITISKYITENKPQMLPTIVVVAYNRLQALKRLLNALNDANFNTKISLVISIDGGGSFDVIKYAKSYRWQHGNKKIIQHHKNLGLKNHIISCGELTRKYGSIIILEDDLYVSPHFYDYVIHALTFYSNDPRISGVSLYNPPLNQAATMPFSPLPDGNDVYFMQIPASSGQAWTSAQWSEFKTWYDIGKHKNELDNLPEYVQKWPNTSWKKYFIAFLIANNKFFVYPKVSLATNFSDDKGTNVKKKTNEHQTELLLFYKDFALLGISDSAAVYDAEFEILPGSIKKLNKELESYDFTVDLYGQKDMARCQSDYVLTSKTCDKYLMSFGLGLRPIELNVILGNHGKELYLAKVSDNIKTRKNNHHFMFYKNFSFFYGRLSIKNIFNLLLHTLLHKILHRR